MKRKQENNAEKIAHICFLTASICFYIAAFIGIISKNESNWIANLCLGSATLCFSTVFFNKEGKDNKN